MMCKGGIAILFIGRRFSRRCSRARYPLRKARRLLLRRVAELAEGVLRGLGDLREGRRDIARALKLVFVDRCHGGAP